MTLLPSHLSGIRFKEKQRRGLCTQNLLRKIKGVSLSKCKGPETSSEMRRSKNLHQTGGSLRFPTSKGMGADLKTGWTMKSFSKRGQKAPWTHLSTQTGGEIHSKRARWCRCLEKIALARKKVKRSQLPSRGTRLHWMWGSSKWRRLLRRLIPCSRSITASINIKEEKRLRKKMIPCHLLLLRRTSITSLWTGWVIRTKKTKELTSITTKKSLWTTLLPSSWIRGPIQLSWHLQFRRNPKTNKRERVTSTVEAKSRNQSLSRRKSRQSQFTWRMWRVKSKSKSNMISTTTVRARSLRKKLRSMWSSLKDTTNKKSSIISTRTRQNNSMLLWGRDTMSQEIASRCKGPLKSTMGSSSLTKSSFKRITDKGTPSKDPK